MIQLISTGEYIDDNPGHGGDTYAVRVYVLRLNPFTLNEWWKSQILNHRNTYGTEEEWEAYKAGKEKLQTAFKEKVADFLKVDLSLGRGEVHEHQYQNGSYAGRNPVSQKRSVYARADTG